jgi:hypothetical protein
MTAAAHTNVNSNPLVMARISKAMPWIISLLFHVGFFLIMLFLVFLSFKPTTREGLVIPNATYVQTPQRFEAPSPVTPSEVSSMTPIRRARRTLSEPLEMASSLQPSDLTQLIATPGIRPESTAATTPTASFFDLPARSPSGLPARQVLYLIDRSGSMIDTFDVVRRELVRSLSRLEPTQSFQIILFAENRPIRFAPQLVAATRENRRQAAAFVGQVVPSGQTRPLAALELAFGMLRDQKGGSAIYLLTDGAFDDNQAVIDTLKSLNRAGGCSIHTLLYGPRPAAAVEVLKTIARQHHGRFRYVPFE